MPLLLLILRGHIPIRHAEEGHDLLGHDLLWPRPTLHGQADLGHGQANFGDNLKLADLGRFLSGGTDLGQRWPPALPWPIWAMAWRTFGGRRRSG